MVKAEHKAVKIAYPIVPKKKFIRRYKAPRGGFGKVHSEYFQKLANDLVQKRNRIELDYLKRPKEYCGYADEGFTVSKAIRDRNGATIKVAGKISMPDLVDYKEDRIYDLKTIIWSLIFCLPKTETGELNKFTADEVVKLVVHRSKHQFERYIKAYWLARNRIPTLMIAVAGFDRRVVCGFHPAVGKWVIIEDEIKMKTIKSWLNHK